MDIFEAVHNNDIAKVKEFLDSGIDVNTQDEELQTSLHIACSYNRVKIVKLLLQNPKINVNIQDKYLDTPLIIACDCYMQEEGEREEEAEERYINIEIVKLLLKNPKINVNIRDRDKKTSLNLACYRNNTSFVKLLLAHPDIDVNNKDIYGNTPLHILLRNKHHYESFTNINQCANIMLDNPKVNINIKDTRKSSILYLSLKNGYLDISKKLLNNPKLKLNKSDELLLSNTILSLDIDTMSILINKFNITKIKKDILFDIYSNRDGDTNKLEYILSNSILLNQLDINTKDDNKDTILHLVSSDNGNLKVLKLLLDIPSIDVNAKNDDDYSPLLLACKNNIAENVKLLLTHPNIKVDFDYNNSHTYLENELFFLADEDLLVNIKIRNLLKSHSNKYKNSINKILDSIED